MADNGERPEKKSGGHEAAASEVRRGALACPLALF